MAAPTFPCNSCGDPSAVIVSASGECQPCLDGPRAEPVPWFHTDDRASDLPAHMQAWQDEARGEGVR